MKVMKFGGTSVGSAQRMKEVAGIVAKEGKNIIVLSAMSGTTNTLLEISDYLHKRNPDGANEIINMLELKYLREIEDLFESKEYKIQTPKSLNRISIIFAVLPKVFTCSKKSDSGQKLLSSVMFTNYLKTRLECRSFAGSRIYENQ